MIGDSVKPTGSSLPLQMLIYFNWHFIVFYFFINLALFTFKAARYYYPGSYLGWDIVIIFLYALVEGTRLLLGKWSTARSGARSLSPVPHPRISLPPPPPSTSLQG